MVEAKQPVVDLSSPDTFVRGVPHAEFARLRRDDPVSWTVGQDGSKFWSVTRHADVVAVSRNTQTFSSALGGAFLAELSAEQLAEQRLLLINMDPPGHSRHRQLVARGFAPKAVAAMEDTIRHRAAALVGRAIEAGECDFVTEVAARLPLETSCDLTGIPQVDHDIVLGWSNQLMASDDPEFNVTPEATSAAGVEAFGYFSALAEERRSRPRDDLVTTLVLAMVQGEQLSDLEIGLFCILLLVGGNETTRNTIAHGALSLIEDPDQRQRVSQDWSFRSPQPGGEVHGETAGGDDEARHDDQAGHALDHCEEARGRRIECLDCDRCSLEGKGLFEHGPCPLERDRRPVGATTTALTGRRAAFATLFTGSIRHL